MSYGLVTYDSSGKEVIRITDRLTRIHGEYNVTVAAGSTTYLSVPGITNNNTWAVVYSTREKFGHKIHNDQVEFWNHSGNSITATAVVLRI